jgi:hypothetical protein
VCVSGGVWVDGRELRSECVCEWVGERGSE